MASIPEKLRDLFDKPIVAGLATLMPDGQPQVTPVWVDYDDEYVRVNTARGRQKDRNMTKRAKVTLLLVDPTNAYHWAEVRGHIADVTEDGAVAHIHQLSHKYRGKDYDLPPQQVRVMYKITVDKVNGSAG
ncbi:MAG: PPOX class F420-dependent oxidoreductase [Anaerolineae bacterium]|nr:PPOX class F420-dependent oxidoreductase [Anaerolineae bacterium]